MSKPVINGYDCILFDEAQDANPPLLDIVNTQKCRKVYVGDKHQQIYSWRGAVNSLSMVSGREMYLTQSFRFGPAVAHYANSLLKMLGEKNPLIGFDRIPTVAARSCVDFKKPYTVLARKNATLIHHLIEHILGKQIYFSVAKDYPAMKQQLLYCWGLKYPEFAVRAPKDFAKFESWEELKETAENDPTYQKLVTLVEEHNIPQLLDEMDQYHVDSEINAKARIAPHITLSTAHSSKGAEYDQVVLMEDFSIRNRRKENRLEPEEVRLLYVAVTRAKKAVNLNALLLNQGKYAALIKTGVRKV